MRIGDWRSLAVFALVMGSLFSMSANASTIEFATFDLTYANRPLSWTDNGNSATIILVSNQATDVQFTFTAASGIPVPVNTYDI